MSISQARAKCLKSRNDAHRPDRGLIGAAVQAILRNLTACGWLWSNGARQQETFRWPPGRRFIPANTVPRAPDAAVRHGILVESPEALHGFAKTI
jgi:hypothetical protein